MATAITLALIARHIGAHQRQSAENVLRQSIFAAAALSLLVITPVIVLAPYLVAAFGVDPVIDELLCLEPSTRSTIASL